jgi:hypothetical protein
MKHCCWNRLVILRGRTPALLLLSAKIDHVSHDRAAVIMVAYARKDDYILRQMALPIGLSFRHATAHWRIVPSSGGYYQNIKLRRSAIFHADRRNNFSQCLLPRPHDAGTPSNSTRHTSHLGVHPSNGTITLDEIRN